MNKESIFSLIRELFAPVALILLGALLLFNPDSASALISKVLGYGLIAVAIGFGIAAISSPSGRTGKSVTAVILAVVGGWLTNNPLALAAWAFSTAVTVFWTVRSRCCRRSSTQPSFFPALPINT